MIYLIIFNVILSSSLVTRVFKVPVKIANNLNNDLSKLKG